jgi:hypothetical protein
MLDMICGLTASSLDDPGWFKPAMDMNEGF